MRRQKLALFAFGLGVLAAPLGFILVESVVSSATAQDEDLIVIESVGDDESPIPAVRENQDLIVIEPADIDNSPPQSQPRRPTLSPTEKFPITDHQSVYLELTRQKARLLSPAELARETDILRRELVELQATQKLRGAEQQLQQLMNEHPNTSAAARARAMLDTMRNANQPNRMLPVPLPDESSIDSNHFNPPPRNHKNAPTYDGPSLNPGRGTKTPNLDPDDDSPNPRGS